MATLFIILFWFVLALVVILFVVAITPISLRAYLRTSPQLAYRVDASILGGLSPNIPIVDSSRPRNLRVKRRKRGGTRRKRKNRRFGRANLWRAFPRLIFGLIGAMRFEYFNIDVEFGLHDPADTGQLFGYLTPVQYAGCTGRGSSLSMRPNFKQACFEGEMNASIRVTVASLLRPVVRFVWDVLGFQK